ncbi:MAG: HAMP domain-containing protein [Oscillospiraceae bacterium]|nr:HAMP domain-containing protein [Oscillospiraceae bacterium]
MFRSLHMKLVMIMLLLITSLMAVVGAFLITGVSSFYIDSFYEQIDRTFSDAQFVSTLRSEAAQENGAERLQTIMEANTGALGIDYNTRNYYILDGATGAFLSGSDEAGGKKLTATANLLAARNGSVGDDSNIAAAYMDAAIPISGGENTFIIYILDNRETVSALSSQLFQIILQALVIGLLISVLLSLLLSKAMVNPIEKLTQGAERVAAGDFGETLEVESADEIGILTGTFNDMSAVLQSTLSAVENERSKLDTLFLHMTDGVVAFDPAGHIIHCNPAVDDMLGRDVSGEQYDTLFGDIFPLQHVLQLQRPNFLESELRSGERALDLYFAPFSDRDSGGALVVLHDVTQQRRQEEQRKEFVANVSHELRTPLTNVRSYAETLRDSGGDIPEELSNNFLDIIINESDRMTHIVQDLLTLSRLDSGRTEMCMARFDFNAAIESVTRAVELAARQHQHQLIVSCETLPLVTGDRGRLEQVMMNILGNAIKYTPDGGKISVSATSDSDYVYLDVADNGIGIPEADRDRIFERFYRVDKARSRESGGTGLGLSIAKEIVEKHGGKLAVIPKEDPGTTIRLTLPILQPRCD